MLVTTGGLYQNIDGYQELLYIIEETRFPHFYCGIITDKKIYVEI